MAEPQIKGVVFRAFMRFLRDGYGEEAVTRVLSLLPPELADKLRADILFTGNWYPLAWYRQMHAAAQEATGAGSELARAKGHAGVTRDLSGIYKIFLRIVSPEFVIGRSAQLFNLYYDTGTMEVLDKRNGGARARWRGCVGFDHNIWVDVLGGCEAALTAAGAKNVRLTVVSGGREGDENMEAEARWE
jgi:hypothetical protein